MEVFIDKMNQDVDQMIRSTSNFQALEKRFKIIASKCNNNNLAVSNDKADNKRMIYMVQRYVRNATDVKHYIIDNRLHVYKIFNGNRPINYWVSSKPLLGYNLRSGKYGYTGIPFFEYSSGGIGNGLPANDLNQYSLHGYIGVCSNERGPVNDMRATSSFSLSPNWGAYGINRYYRNLENRQCVVDGDLYSYIHNLRPYAEDEQYVGELRSTLNILNRIALYTEKNSKEKRNFLRELLGINKGLSSDIDAFAKSKGR